MKRQPGQDRQEPFAFPPDVTSETEAVPRIGRTTFRPEVASLREDGRKLASTSTQIQYQETRSTTPDVPARRPPVKLPVHLDRSVSTDSMVLIE